MSSIRYRQYTGESDLPHIMALVQHELSEPYVIYTYRYFLHQWYVLLRFGVIYVVLRSGRPHLSYLVSLIPRASTGSEILNLRLGISRRLG